MRSVLVASQKGGVGKTTTAVNLAALAAAAGSRVALLDADPLGSVAASLQLTRDAADPDPDGNDGADSAAVWSGVAPNLDVVCPYPADDTGEAHLEGYLANLPGSDFAAAHDLLVIDAPPMLGPRLVALLHAADDVLIVLRAEPMGFRTLPAYLELVREVKAAGGTCRLRGILLTLPPGTPAGGPGEAALRAKFKGILPQTIPYDAEVGRALVLGRPLVEVAPDSPAARPYHQLAASLGLTRAAVPVAAARHAARPEPAAEPVESAVRYVEPPDPPEPPEPEKSPANPLALSPEQKADGGGSAVWPVAIAVAAGFAAVVIGLWLFTR